ncbi:very short patch repair endonuclease [Sphingopyxis sp. H115]|uniref:very short patch repair endonuclease n=1 Tax=Sphingopyxis sp. H115 TaxID=1759073 RepID=UPI0009E9D0DA|nr:very short patch repair endonuclease [Sphingopyxis sp. H115]
MIDFVSPEKRSRIMRGSKGKDTRPEIAVRRVLRRLGIGYRLHRNDLPGRPDIALIGRKKAIFVHGCFWHQHGDLTCPIVRRPSSNSGFWSRKFEKTRERDIRNERALVGTGWSVLTLWECETLGSDLEAKLRSFLEIS